MALFTILLLLINFFLFTTFGNLVDRKQLALYVASSMGALLVALVTLLFSFLTFSIFTFFMLLLITSENFVGLCPRLQLFLLHSPSSVFGPLCEYDSRKIVHTERLSNTRVLTSILPPAGTITPTPVSPVNGASVNYNVTQPYSELHVVIPETLQSAYSPVPWESLNSHANANGASSSATWLLAVGFLVVSYGIYYWYNKPAPEVAEPSAAIEKTISARRGNWTDNVTDMHNFNLDNYQAYLLIAAVILGVIYIYIRWKPVRQH